MKDTSFHAIIRSMKIDKIEALRRTALFGRVDETQLRELAEVAVERRVRRDEVLFLAGDEAAGLFVIAEGSLRAYREGLDGREQVIHVERAGATIAELPVFDDKPYPSNVAADEDSILLFIDKRSVLSLCLTHPQIALASTRLLAGRLRRCAELVEALSLHEVDQRLAQWILNEARIRGKKFDQDLILELVLTNQQIAARIGTVREVVSRALNRLQTNGLIDLNGRSITIRDFHALEIFAGG
ncbi:MAG: Crp/Fnr family transcriptional regulator [Acidobacteriota bacterium]|nr:MAG: Crp/Fnr family transcriptional regulator [Acidobacteriota bacterium]